MFVGSWNPQNIQLWTLNQFNLQNVLGCQHSMSVKKQLHSLSNFFSNHEEVFESFLDETDVDNCFYWKKCNISQFHHRIVWVSYSSNKNIIAVKFFRFCDIKTRQQFILDEKLPITRKKLSHYKIFSLHFWQRQNKPAHPQQFFYRDPKQKLAPHCCRTTSLLTAKKIFQNNPSVEYNYLFVLNKTTSVSFPSENSALLRPSGSCRDC